MSRVLLAVIVGLLVLGLAGCGIGCSWYNEAVSLEESVKAQYLNNKNEYDAFWKKVKEVAQVPDKYKEDFKELLLAETKAKYGESGSQAQFQWFKDREIYFDSSTYKKVMDVIEIGRNDFKRAQTELLDKQRKYAVHLKTGSGIIISRLTGFPKPVGGELSPPKDLDGDGELTVLDYSILTSEKTEKAFDSGKDEELKVFK